MKIDINSKAPIRSRKSIRIHAPAVTIWSYLTQIDQWPKWQSAVEETHLDTPPREGVDFDWKSGGISLKSTIHTCEPFLAFGWMGKALGGFAVHNWHIKTLKNDTVVFLEESVQGFLPSMFRKIFQRTLEKNMLRNLRELKLVCEK